VRTGTAQPEERSSVACGSSCLEDRGVVNLIQDRELRMNIDAVTPLRQRMVEDMSARKLCAQTQRGHIRSCKRFAEFLNQSPDTATAEDIRRFQLHLSETSTSICNRSVS